MTVSVNNGKHPAVKRTDCTQLADQRKQTTEEKKIIPVLKTKTTVASMSGKSARSHGRL